MKTLLLCGAILCAYTLAAPAHADRGGVIFYAPLDGSVDAAYSAGNSKGIPEGQFCRED